MDDAISNSSKKRNGSKSRDLDSNNIVLYTLKKGNSLNSANRQTSQTNIKKKLLHKSKKHLS